MSSDEEADGFHGGRRKRRREEEEDGSGSQSSGDDAGKLSRRRGRRRGEDDAALYGVFMDDDGGGGEEGIRPHPSGLPKGPLGARPLSFVAREEAREVEEEDSSQFAGLGAARREAEEGGGPMLTNDVFRAMLGGARAAPSLEADAPLRRPLPTKADPSFGRFEAHTKGFGAKYLSKFGFAGRLGKHEQGIVAPVDVKVRPAMLGLGFGGFKEASKLKANVAVERDYAGREGDGEVDEEGEGGGRALGAHGPPPAARRVRPVKVVYKTAAELIAAADAEGGPVASASLVSVIDLTGRVVGSVQDALREAAVGGGGNEGQGGAEAPTIGRELLHNVGILADVAGVALGHAHRKLRAGEAAMNSLAREVAATAVAEAAANAHAAAVTGLRDSVSMWVARVRSACDSARVAHSVVSGGVQPQEAAAPIKLTYLQQMYGGGAAARPTTSSSADEVMGRGRALDRLASTLSDAASALFALSAAYPALFHSLGLLERVGPAIIADALPTLVMMWDAGRAVVDAPRPGAPTLPDVDVHDGATRALLAALRPWAVGVAARPEADAMDEEEEEEEEVEAGGIPLPPEGLRGAARPSRLGVRSSAALAAFHRLTEAHLLPPLRAALGEGGWDAKQPRAALALVLALSGGGEEGHASLLPVHALHSLFHTSILPRLVDAARTWDPVVDPQPVQDWAAPWATLALPDLGAFDALSVSVWPILRAHMAEGMGGWHPSDPTAIAMMRPWANLWEPAAMEGLLSRVVLPRLVAVLRELTTPTGAGQPFAPAQEACKGAPQSPSCLRSQALGWVTAWCVGEGGLLTPSHVSALLEGEWLRPFMRSLAAFLSPLFPLSLPPSPARTRALLAGVAAVQWPAVLDWYTGWRAALPPALLALPALRRVLWHSAHTLECGTRLAQSLEGGMEAAVEDPAVGAIVAEVTGVLAEYSAERTYSALLRRDALGAASSSGTRPAQPIRQPPAPTQPADLTFREFVEGSLAEAGLALLPNPRRPAVDGSPVFKAGELNLYLQNGVVFAEGGEGGPQVPRYAAVSVADLVQRARQSMQRR